MERFLGFHNEAVSAAAEGWRCGRDVFGCGRVVMRFEELRIVFARSDFI